MYIVISPAKKLDFETQAPVNKSTSIKYLDKANKLINSLREYSTEEIKKLMKLSDSLADLNVQRYKDFSSDFNDENSKQAMFAFNGDTYVGLEANSLEKDDVKYAQDHLGILSGLYGLLRPLDRIQPYRLEMGTRFACDGKKNLYEFWKEDVTADLNKVLKKEEYLVNCSSNEYFSVIDLKSLKGKVITPVFKEKKGDTYKVVGFCAKRARGMMAKFIIENKITKPSELKKFNIAGYKYDKSESDDSEFIFKREV